MGHVTTYLILIFAISICLYLGDYQSPLMQLLSNNQITNDAGTFRTGLGTDEANLAQFLDSLKLAFIIAAGSAAVTAFVTGGSSLARSVGLMVFFGIFLMNVLFLPLSFMFDQTLPTQVRYIIFGFMQILLVLAAIELMAERDI